MNASEPFNNATNLSHIPTLEEIEFNHFLEEGVPAFTFVMVLSIVGICGNIHTILIYAVSPDMKKKKLHVRVLILWLSAVDLFVCVVIMPFEMVDVRLSYTVSSNLACKLFRYLSHASAISSGMLLALIARERYQKAYDRVPNYHSKLSCLTRTICVKQLRLKSTEFQYNVVSILVIIISLAFATPILVFLGIEKFPSNFAQRSGTECTTLRQYNSISNAGLYSGIFGFLALLCFVICSYSYGRILQLIYKQSKQNRKMKYNINMNSASTNDAGEAERREYQHISTTQKEPDLAVDKRDRFEGGRQLTISLIAATSVSLLGYLLFASAAAIRVSNPEFESRIRRSTALLIRAFFINSAANPVAYLMFDKNYRKAWMNLYINLCCKLNK